MSEKRNWREELVGLVERIPEGFYMRIIGMLEEIDNLRAEVERLEMQILNHQHVADIYRDEAKLGWRTVRESKEENDRLRADLNYRMEEEQLAKMQLEVALSELKTLRAELKDVEMHLETFRDERDALMEQNKTLRAELDMWKNHYAPRDEREFTGEESYEQSIRCKGG